MTYKEKRSALVAKAQKLIDEGKITDANDVMQEIRDLDAQHEESATAAANLAALSNTMQAVTPIAPLMTGQGVFSPTTATPLHPQTKAAICMRLRSTVTHSKITLSAVHLFPTNSKTPLR